jgi:hypothetical protein
MWKEWANTMYWLWRRQRVESLTDSQKIAIGKGYLVSFHASGEGGGAFHIHLHDGVDSNGKVLVHSHGATNGTDSFTPSMPIPFNEGLYVYFSSGSPAITVVLIDVAG